MQSQSICAAIAAAVFLLAASASHAQNKCLDEKGRVTYQSDPCPGASARIRTPAEIARSAPPLAPAPRPAPAAAPARAGSSAAAPPAATYSGPSPQALRIEMQELEKCYGDWDMYEGAVERGRREIERQRARGRDTQSAEFMERQLTQRSMARFLPVCGKYGFESPRDDAAIKRNSEIARALERKMDAKQAEMEAAGKREQMARESASNAREAAQQAERNRPECERAARQIAEARAALPQMTPNLREKLQKDLAKADREYNEACAR